MAWSISVLSKPIVSKKGWCGVLHLVLAENKKGEKWQHEKAFFQVSKAEAFAERVRAAQRGAWAGPTFDYWRKLPKVRLARPMLNQRISYRQLQIACMN